MDLGSSAACAKPLRSAPQPHCQHENIHMLIGDCTSHIPSPLASELLFFSPLQQFPPLQHILPHSRTTSDPTFPPHQQFKSRWPPLQVHLPGIFSGQIIVIHCLPIATRRLQAAQHCPNNLSQSLSHTDMQTHRSQQIYTSSAHRWAPKLMQLMPKLYRDRIYPG